MPTLEDRINNLETTVALQQREYDALNEVVIAQSRQIEELQRQVHDLKTMLKEIAERSPRDDVAEAPPPHY